MTSATDFAKMVPGFDFLQSLMGKAGAGVPHIGQWIAPTLDPQEIEKRIGELRTVQFWLEQNARLLATTIQALEVQRMTLSTLQTMNLPLADLRDALTLQVPKAAAAVAAEAAAPVPPPQPAARAAAPASAATAATAAPAATAATAATAAGSKAAPAVDPLLWWGALTQQFTELASKALQDSTGEGGRAAAAGPAKTARATKAAKTARAGKTAARGAAATSAARGARKA